MTRTAAGRATLGRPPALFLDANVLLPQYLRSVFLDLADAELVAVHWSETVLDEVRRHLVTPKFGRSAADVERLFAVMSRAFPDALVRGSERLRARFDGKTDPGDAHVAAGALKLSQSLGRGSTVMLITSNSRHLPQDAFDGTAVRCSAPGAFLKALLHHEPSVATVLDAMVRRFVNPPVTRQDLLAVLDRCGCRVFATALGKAWGFERS